MINQPIKSMLKGDSNKLLSQIQREKSWAGMDHFVARHSLPITSY